MSAASEASSGASPGIARVQAPGLLDVNNIEVVYNDVILVLRGLSLRVPQGKIVALLGANGAGKSTTLKAISGLLRTEEGEVTRGEIRFGGERINGTYPHQIVRRDRKSTRLNSSHANISYAVFCLKKKSLTVTIS